MSEFAESSSLRDCGPHSALFRTPEIPLKTEATREAAWRVGDRLNSFASRLPCGVGARDWSVFAG
jgi:hypothetical protein